MQDDSKEQGGEAEVGKAETGRRGPRPGIAAALGLLRWSYSTNPNAQTLAIFTPPARLRAEWKVHWRSVFGYSDCPSIYCILRETLESGEPIPLTPTSTSRIILCRSASNCGVSRSTGMTDPASYSLSRI